MKFEPVLAIPAHEMDREGIGELVAEVKGMRWSLGEAFDPCHAVAETLALHLTIAGIRFEEQVAGSGDVECGEDVLGELAVVGTLLDEGKASGLAETFPFAAGEHGEQSAEKRPGAHAGEEIAIAAEATRAAAIITMLRMVESHLHDRRERHQAAGSGGDLLAEECFEGSHGKEELADWVKGA
jgi:hypothetical protein